VRSPRSTSTTFNLPLIGYISVAVSGLEPEAAITQDLLIWGGKVYSE